MLKLPFISRGNGRRAQNLPKVITEISIRIKEIQDKLEESLRRLKDRDRELFEKTVRSKLDGDEARAIIYAQEISDIRKMIKVIYTAVLALEKVRLKLETVHELQNFSSVIFPVVKILDELKLQIKNIAPEVALALDSITNSVNSIAVETGMINEKSINPVLTDEKAKEILEEAQKQAEMKMKEMLPDLPHPPLGSESLQLSQKPRKVSKRLSEEELLEYLKSTGGVLDLEHITKIYGVNKDEVLLTLNKLVEKGLVVIT
jgi:division protein CdvB (Snf7/Vps24/ESCRT-III family)